MRSHRQMAIQNKNQSSTPKSVQVREHKHRWRLDHTGHAFNLEVKYFTTAQNDREMIKQSWTTFGKLRDPITHDHRISQFITQPPAPNSISFNTPWHNSLILYWLWPWSLAVCEANVTIVGVMAVSVVIFFDGFALHPPLMGEAPTRR